MTRPFAGDATVPTRTGIHLHSEVENGHAYLVICVYVPARGSKGGRTSDSRRGRWMGEKTGGTCRRPAGGRRRVHYDIAASTFLGLRRTSLSCQLSDLSLLFQLSEHLQIFSCVSYLKFCSGSALFCCVLRQEPFCLFLSWKINGNVGQPRHRLKGTSAGFPAGRFPVFLGP